MLDDSLYDTTGFCRHGLSVDLINKKQILFVPVLKFKNISEAAAIYDYPMAAEEIGRLIFKFFEEMKTRNLTLHTPYKNLLAYAQRDKKLQKICGVGFFRRPHT